MLAHQHPFLVSQRPVFQQDAVWDGHFTDIMQQRPAVNILEVFFGNSNSLSQVDRHLSHTARMPFSFLVTQFQSPRPTFNGGVIGSHQALVKLFEAVSQIDTVDTNRRLPRQGFKKPEPVCIRGKRLASENR